MDNKNQTSINEFFLVGFSNLNNLKIPLFFVLQLIYLLAIWENILIIVLVSTSHNLRSPMYFFLQHLSMCDLLETTTIVPILLSTVMNNGVTISFKGCITQLYFLSTSVASQCTLLSVMSYDRYLAICNPLRYTSIMNHRDCIKLVSSILLFCFIAQIFTANIISTLKFCNENRINHFFCDLTPLLDLSCSDTSLVIIYINLLSVPVMFLPFLLIILSYIYIARAVLNIVSNTSRQKAFSTCSSHLAVVSLFYGTLIGVYVVPPQKELQTISNVISLLYTVFIPVVNPIIYSLRNKDMKEALKKSIGRFKRIKSLLK